MHDSREGFKKLFRKKERSWNGSGNVVVHQSVIDRSEGGGRYNPWILRGKNYDVDPW